MNSLVCSLCMFVCMYVCMYVYNILSFKVCASTWSNIKETKRINNREVAVRYGWVRSEGAPFLPVHSGGHHSCAIHFSPPSPSASSVRLIHAPRDKSVRSLSSRQVYCIVYVCMYAWQIYCTVQAKVTSKTYRNRVCEDIHCAFVRHEVNLWTHSVCMYACMYECLLPYVLTWNNLISKRKI